MKSVILLLAVMAVVALAVEEPHHHHHSRHERELHKLRAIEEQHEVITLPTKAPKSSLLKATVIQPPPHRHHHLKIRGNFSVRPLLDNGKEFLKHHIPRRYKLDECTGCVVPEKIPAKLDPRNRLDHKGRVVGKKRVLPVQPELRERYHRHHHHHGKHHKKHHKRVHHHRPEFYPLTKEQRKKVHKREHHRKVIKRLPNIPEFYPHPKPARLFNPPGGWPCEGNCDKKKKL